MMVSGKEVEEAITRLTEMARAAGIHLILTTVKPLSEVMTREMKANFNTRIAFRTASHADSKSIIEVTGAEDLLMGSDMLFLPSASKEPIRIHGAFVDEKEIARIVEHVKAQGEALFDDTITKTEEELDDSGDLPGKRDPLFWDAVKSVVHAKRASTSLLQRHLRIGYGRAAAILDEMVKEGYIGDMDGSSRARPVLQCAYDDLQNLSDMAELVVIPKSTNSELIKTNTETKGIQKRLTGGVLSRTKICTTCHAIYKDNDLKFCLSDGTTLVWTGKDASLAHLIANIDARLATRVLTTIAIISLLVTMGSCVGCYASTASTYSQYDGKYGNPHDQLTFASVMGLAFLVLCITSVAALFFGISEDQRPKPTNSNVAHIKMLFKLFAWTTVISAVMSLGGCVGFIVTRPPPGDFSSVVVDYGKQTFLPFAYTAFFAYLIYLGALIGTFRNYYPSISKDR